MLTHWRSRVIVSTAIGTALVGGLLVIPASSTELPPVEPASAVAIAHRDAYVAGDQALSEVRAEAATHRVALAAASARAATVRKTAQMRTTAVRIALTRKGMDYSAGSAGPTRFDCSGFTSWVWRQAGRTIERTSWDQFATLKPVSRAKAKPGDLVFFFGNGAHHVAVYLGNNRIIHAANYGTGVVVTDLNSGAGHWYADRLSGFRSVV